MSASQSWSGRSAVKLRSTRSEAGGAAGWGVPSAYAPRTRRDRRQARRRCAARRRCRRSPHGPARSGTTAARPSVRGASCLAPARRKEPPRVTPRAGQSRETGCSALSASIMRKPMAADRSPSCSYAQQPRPVPHGRRWQRRSSPRRAREESRGALVDVALLARKAHALASVDLGLGDPTAHRGFGEVEVAADLADRLAARPAESHHLGLVGVAERRSLSSSLLHASTSFLGTCAPYLGCLSGGVNPK